MEQTKIMYLILTNYYLNNTKLMRILEIINNTLQRYKESFPNNNLVSWQKSPLRTEIQVWGISCGKVWTSREDRMPFSSAPSIIPFLNNSLNSNSRTSYRWKNVEITLKLLVTVMLYLLLVRWYKTYMQHRTSLIINRNRSLKGTWLLNRLNRKDWSNKHTRGLLHHIKSTEWHLLARLIMKRTLIMKQ